MTKARKKKKSSVEQVKAVVFRKYRRCIWRSCRRNFISINGSYQCPRCATKVASDMSRTERKRILRVSRYLG